MRRTSFFIKLVLFLLISGGLSLGTGRNTDLQKTSQNPDKSVRFSNLEKGASRAEYYSYDNLWEQVKNSGGIQNYSEPGLLPGKEFNLSNRLVEVGETIAFSLSGLSPGDRLEIFPRYLENCSPTLVSRSKVPLQWLDSLESISLPVKDMINYIPEVPGNYIARWTSQRYGVEYRYFAAIDQSYLVYRPAVWNWPAPFPNYEVPELHNTGLPFDWVIGYEKTEDSYVRKLIAEQQRYGGGIVYGMADPCKDGISGEKFRSVLKEIENFRQLGLEIGKVANLYFGGGLSNNKVMTARAMGFEVIDGYVPRGDCYGMGGPYYPFFIGDVDYRFPDQDGPSNAISFIYDFVGSWHFHGPVGFHRPSANGSWEYARSKIDLAAREAVINAKNSQMHNIITTLINYESPVAWGNEIYQVTWDEERGIGFFKNYLSLLAFEQPKEMPVVFARAADYADYFRTHYRKMPRRIISSITHDPEYDKFWTDEWHEQHLMPAGYVPVNQSLINFRKERLIPKYNMSMSNEFINYNDNTRTCRFEYACPKPVHYYDLTGSVAWPQQPEEVNLPDPDIKISTIAGKDSYEVIYSLTSDSFFKDYLLAIWNIPREYRDCRFETNASEFTWIENTDGNYRGIIRFDLAGNCELKVKWICQ